MVWRAWEGKGLPGEPVRELLIEAVEQRFSAVGAIPEGYTLEFLTDNGGLTTALNNPVSQVVAAMRSRSTGCATTPRYESSVRLCSPDLA
jgi:hypothetical protein